MGKKIAKKKVTQNVKTLTVLPTRGLMSTAADICLLLLMFMCVMYLGVMMLDFAREIHITVGPQHK